jgi:predicted TIM-barrel fold metal-dependent hydrolase
MIIIDSQVHAYEANTSKRPWHSVPNWPDHVTGDEMVAAMDKVGVDGALHQEPYPFQDIWDPLARVFDAWGFDRCL